MRARAGRRPPLVILWNHRWEFEKNPETFFDVVFFLAEEGVPFKLALVGEATRKWPPVFERARKRLADWQAKRAQVQGAIEALGA